MVTIIEKVNSFLHEEIVIEKAASIIKSGGLVAFPTETVYGLGANGLDKKAAYKIYHAKGRPADNPLILHIDSVKSVYSLAENVCENAKKAMEKFWPGPLTIILEKSEIVPYEVTSGLSTVAIRFPQNRIALSLIKKSGVPIAAPSANSSGKPSPTRASHVAYDLSGKIDMIIDGGPCKFGIESTIVDFTSNIPVILRPGSITKYDLEQCLNCEVYEKYSLDSQNNVNFPPKAPGMKYKHYSPSAKVFIICGDPENVIIKINELVELAKTDKLKPGVLASNQQKQYYKCDFVLAAGDRDLPETIGRNLFKMLRKFDHYGIDVVYAEGYTFEKVGAAVMNRLIKASENNIIMV